MSVTAIVLALVDPIAKLLGKTIPDKDAANKLAHEIATLAGTQAHEIALAQIGVNEAEAKHPSVFVSGWRPAAGWVCVFGMGFNFVLLPLTGIACSLVGYDVELPKSLDLDVMMPVLLGMLGLGFMRTKEKQDGVARVG